MNPQRPSVYEAQVGENDNQCVWWIALDPSGFSRKAPNISPPCPQPLHVEDPAQRGRAEGWGGFCF